MQHDSRVMMSNGKLLDILDPDPNAIDISVIAQALSRQCRYNGHSSRFYSVAEHCVLVSELLEFDHDDQHLALIGLLHDAAEAFVGDIITPIKRMLPSFKPIEWRVQAAVYKRFGLMRFGWSSRWATTIKEADNLAAAIEVDQLMPPSEEYWHHLHGLSQPEDWDWPTLGWPSPKAEQQFLDRFEELAYELPHVDA